MRRQTFFLAQTNGQGFTLVELLIVLSVFAILLGLAAPSFMSIIANNRVANAANEIVTALNVGKSEAVRSGEHTVLCKSPDGASCDSSATWNQGWLLFQDSNGNREKEDGERIIRLQQDIEPSLEFDFRTGNYIAFRPNGRTPLNENGRFCFRNNHEDANSRTVIITMTGHVRIEVGNYTCI